MSQKGILAVIVVVIIVIAGAWYLLSYNPTMAPAAGSGTQATSTATTGTNSTTSGTQATTLQGVMTQGGNYTCSIQTTGTDTKTTGTIYGTGGKTRLDLVISQGGLDTTTHIIRSGTTSYMWVDGQQTGVKSTITPTAPIVQPNGGVISANTATSCHPWIPDPSQFIPPTGISFKVQ